MKKNNKTKASLLQELEALKQENDELKTRLKKGDTNCKTEESKFEHSENNLPPVFNAGSICVSNEDVQSLRHLLDNYLRMYASRDDLLTTYFSDNFSGFTGGGDFLVKDKNEWIAITRQDFSQVKDAINIELKDFSIQSLSDTIAVATSFFTIRLPIKDHILSRETARLVLIFRKESGGWKISHSSISIPYYLVREGEVYPMKELVERNRFLEELVTERTIQLSFANSNLQKTNEELAKEILEHKKAEEALQQSNHKLEAIISATPDGIGMISFDGKMQLMSDKLIEMYGYSIEQKNELIGRSSFDFIDPSNHVRLYDNIRKLITGSGENRIKEYMAIKKDNSRFYIDVNSTILHDPAGNPSSILFVERDITERKKAELIIREQNNQLHALNATKDKFFSIIAHDLISPFQGFIGITQIMAEDIESLSNIEISSLSKELNENAKNLFKLLSNLLEWARMQQGTVSFNPEDIVLSEVVSHNIDTIIKRGEQKGIDIILEFPQNHSVFADEAMLNTVLRNLLSNAVKFTKRGGKIKISSGEAENNMIEISVKDNGIGMPGSLSEKLFKIEEKVGRNGTEGEPSTGLGLLLCKEFVEKNGGRLWFESCENTGSTFYFTLRSTDK